MKPDRAWVLLPSGQRLDLLTPDAGAWTDQDLAIGLSRTYRWGGHSCWDLPLSVAQHSLLVLVIRQQMNTLHHLTAAEALRELLHDADEGLLGFDPISPLKRHLGEGFKAVAGRLRAAIDTRYQVLPWRCDDYLQHKQADHLAAACKSDDACPSLKFVAYPGQHRLMPRRPARQRAGPFSANAAVRPKGIDRPFKAPFLYCVIDGPRLRCASSEPLADGTDHVPERGFAVLGEQERTGRHLLEREQVQRGDIVDMDVRPDIEAAPDMAGDA